MADAFTVVIDQPADGTVTDTTSVQVNGTCSSPGSSEWSIGTTSSFEGGALNGLTYGPGNTLAFPQELSDEFDRPDLDAALWDSQPTVSSIVTGSGDSIISIWGGPSPSSSDDCRIITKPAFSFNPSTTSKTFECCATRQDVGDDWMAMLTVYHTADQYVALSWGVGGEHGGSDSVVALEVHVGSSHPSYIGGSVECGRFYQFKLTVASSTATGYYRASSSDPWAEVASASYSFNGQHSMMMGRPWPMGGGGAGHWGCMTVDWVADTGAGGWRDDFDSPTLNSTLWSSEPNYRIDAKEDDRYLEIMGGPSKGPSDQCRIRSRSPYTLNPARERAAYTARASKMSGNDWMGMLMLHSDDSHFAGVSWGVDAESGGELDTISLVSWTPEGHSYKKSAALVLGSMYEFRLLIDPPGTLKGFYRESATQAWSLIGSADYQVNATHSVLVGRPTGLGGASGYGYSARMLVDWVRQEPRLTGEYTSFVKDLACDAPVAEEVSWNWVLLPGSGSSVYYRSADDPRLVPAAPWVQATNEAHIGVRCGRFVQLRAVLTRANPLVEPSLLSMTLTYSGVLEVRVSTDGVNWTVASGTGTWSAVLELKEGRNKIFAEATDCSGGRTASAVTVTVDTQPPEGEVRINGGADYANSPDIRLSVSAHDATGVTEMMVTDTGNFSSAKWTQYKNVLDWKLSPGDGERTVSVVFRDRFGHVSSTCLDSIVLDTTPPTTALAIDGGAPYTRLTNVTVTLSVTEAYWTEAVQLSAYPDFRDVAWSPPQTSVAFKLPIGDGPKTIYARAKDATGNIGPAGTASIILDTVAPVSGMIAQPSETINTSLALNWSGTDATSGGLLYDLEYRDGTGPWTAWLSSTAADGAIFDAQVDHTYMFRVRARDRAGNVEPMPDGAQLSVHVRAPRAPTVSILLPQANTAVNGIIIISGTSSHPEPGFEVVGVQIQLDDGEWLAVFGTAIWSHTLDTSTLSDGRHVVRARSYDGERHSIVKETPFDVKNAPPPDPVRSMRELIWPIIALIIVVVVVIAALMYWRGRQVPPTVPPGDRPS